MPSLKKLSLVLTLGLATPHVFLTLPAQTTNATLNADYHILAQIQKVYSDSLFAGASIFPVVDHGVVTLTGAVRNDTQKELASRELSHIPGVKTVLNNLDVSKFNQPAKYPTPSSSANDQSSGTARQPYQAPVETSKVITVGSGATLSVRLSQPLSSKTAKTNDTFDAVTTGPLTWNGYTAIPTGTHIVGRILDSKAAGRVLKLPSLSIDIVNARLTSTNGQVEDVLLTTHPLISSYGNTNPYSEGPPRDIELQPDHLLQFHLSEPLTITVQLKDGHQIL